MFSCFLMRCIQKKKKKKTKKKRKRKDKAASNESVKKNCIVNSSWDLQGARIKIG